MQYSRHTEEWFAPSDIRIEELAEDLYYVYLGPDSGVRFTYSNGTYVTLGCGGESPRPWTMEFVTVEQEDEIHVTDMSNARGTEGTTYVFDEATYKLKWILDSSGTQIHTYSYDTDLVEIEDQLGVITQYRYSNGKLVKLIAPNPDSLTPNENGTNGTRTEGFRRCMWECP